MASASCDGVTGDSVRRCEADVCGGVGGERRGWEGGEGWTWTEVEGPRVGADTDSEGRNDRYFRHFHFRRLPRMYSMRNWNC
jgi:hypothetical protein